MSTRRFRVVLAALVVPLTGGLAGGEGPVKSGLQPGEMIPSAFSPLNVNGEYAGQKHCLVCENGLNPVVMIFAREVSEPLLRLLGKIEAASAKERDLGSFVVFLSTKEGLEKQLAEVGKKQALKRLVLSIDDPPGPEDYKVSKDAEVTVVLYTKHVVKANHAFKKGELTDKAIDKIVADLPKIVPEKK